MRILIEIECIVPNVVQSGMLMMMMNTLMKIKTTI